MKCTICNDDIREDSLGVVLKKKGLASVLNACLVRGKEKVYEAIELKSSSGLPVNVHIKCRKELTDLRKVVIDEKPPPAKKTRSSLEPFDWETCCLYCGENCEETHQDRKQICLVRTVSLRQNILDICNLHPTDPVLTAVAHRVQNCIDLVAVRARYHKICSSTFYKFKQTAEELDEKPLSHEQEEKKRKPGKPIDHVAAKAFENTCKWLESTAEPLFLCEVEAHMTGLAGADHMWSRRYLQEKLVHRYGDHIEITNEGYRNVVRLRDMARRMINDKWYQDRKPDHEEEEKRIILAAAKIIKEEIREKEYDKSVYPDEKSIASVEEGKKWIPKSLNVFLESLIESKVKQNSLGQCIVYAVRPKSTILPVPFGLGIEMDHIFGSRWNTSQLSDLGFSISYDEVNRYKQSVLHSERVEKIIPISELAFTQWAADNADHPTRTIDGKNTFHGMGCIASTTSINNNTVPDLPLIRRMKRLPVESLTKDKGIPIVPFIGPKKSGLSDFIFEPRDKIPQRSILVPKYASNSLWHVGWMFASKERNHPNWPGFMQNIKAERIIEKSDVYILPLIDQDPTSDTCIYSTLLNISKQAETLKIETPCVTFDQPLWLKALGIAKAKGMNIVCRLGGFHTLMSFLGSIGTLMEGSGIEGALSEVYGENVIPQLLSGHAYSRSIRGHFLLEAALKLKLIEGISTELTDKELQDLDKILSDVMAGYCGYEEIEKSDAIKNFERKMDQLQNTLKIKSRTAKFWIQYLDYINIIKVFITAERTGNWELHLLAVEKMLNLFAATGHIHYAKSARLYLQEMNKLKTKYPWLYEKFIDGYHPVRRHERYWSGLWTDLAIEQMLMGLLKGRSGLTRGRGMTESVRHLWIHSMHRCVSVHDAMTKLTNRPTRSSEQHVDLGQSRCRRDYEDMLKMKAWLDQHEPFDENISGLRSLSTGLTAKEGDGVNCDKAEEVGLKIHRKLDNVVFTEAKISRVDHVKPLAFLFSNVKLGKKVIYINPLTLFTRLIAMVQREDNIENYFEYEMTTSPISLFKDGLMRKPDKPALRKHLVDGKVPECRGGGRFILDGGALLHYVRWVKGETYGETCGRYAKHIEERYGTSTVIFDGYELPSPKDHEHRRREGLGKTSADINVNHANKAHNNQESFLTNTHNKQQFINLLSHHLRQSGHSVVNCEDDADTKIALSAVEYAGSKGAVTVVADDTDVLFLLVHHFESNMEDMFFRSERASKTWSIRDIIQKMTPLVKDHILFLHAWSGCDTTSSIYDQGKVGVYKKLQSSKTLQDLSSRISDPLASENDVIEAGHLVFLHMYNGDPSGSLTKLRCGKFHDMVTKSNSGLIPEKLPPTEAAAKYHSLRVHLQLTVWKTLDTSALDPLKWGWRMENESYEPITTDQPVAPDAILNFVRCKCKKDTKNPCGSNRCSCRKYGLNCVAACGDCRGESCRNTRRLEEEEENVENAG